MDELDLVKRFINIDFPDDDVLLEQMIESAKIYFANAGVYISVKNEALYKHTLQLFVRQMYENREICEPNLFISNLLNQLRFSHE